VDFLNDVLVEIARRLAAENDGGQVQALTLALWEFRNQSALAATWRDSIKRVADARKDSDSIFLLILLQQANQAGTGWQILKQVLPEDLVQHRLEVLSFSSEHQANSNSELELWLKLFVCEASRIESFADFFQKWLQQARVAPAIFDRLCAALEQRDADGRQAATTTLWQHYEQVLREEGYRQKPCYCAAVERVLRRAPITDVVNIIDALVPPSVHPSTEVAPDRGLQTQGVWRAVRSTWLTIVTRLRLWKPPVVVRDSSYAPRLQILWQRICLERRQFSTESREIVASRLATRYSDWLLGQCESVLNTNDRHLQLQRDMAREWCIDFSRYAHDHAALRFAVTAVLMGGQDEFAATVRCVANTHNGMRHGEFVRNVAVALMQRNRVELFPALVQYVTQQGEAIRRLCDDSLRNMKPRFARAVFAATWIVPMWREHKHYIANVLCRTKSRRLIAAIPTEYLPEHEKSARMERRRRMVKWTAICLSALLAAYGLYYIAALPKCTPERFVLVVNHPSYTVLSIPAGTDSLWRWILTCGNAAITVNGAPVEPTQFQSQPTHEFSKLLPKANIGGDALFYWTTNQVHCTGVLSNTVPAGMVREHISAKDKQTVCEQLLRRERDAQPKRNDEAQKAKGFAAAQENKNK
jgi:hypothetical protein